MNKNGLCREVGLIIIRFKSVKAFSQISPRRRWVKNPFVGSVPWQRARLPGDRGYDRRECACVSVGWGYICVCVCVYVWVCASVCMHVCGAFECLQIWESVEQTGSQTHKDKHTNQNNAISPFLGDFRSGSLLFFKGQLQEDLMFNLLWKIKRTKGS